MDAIDKKVWKEIEELVSEALDILDKNDIEWVNLGLIKSKNGDKFYHVRIKQSTISD